MLRELRPRLALFENVPGLFATGGGRFFNRVLSDISASGYDAEWKILSAADVGAPHKRERIWIVAYSKSLRLERVALQCETDRKSTTKARKEWQQFYKTPYRNNKIINWQEIESELCGDDDGFPFDVERFNCLGNAIVPQCAELIMRLPAFDAWREVSSGTMGVSAEDRIKYAQRIPTKKDNVGLLKDLDMEAV